MQVFKATVPVFPCTLKADVTFLIGLPAFAVAFGYGTFLSLRLHQYAAITITTTFGLVLCALAVAAYSYRLKVDDEGLHFSWIMGKRGAKWTDVVRIEKTSHTFALYNKDNVEVVPLSVLHYVEQKAVADRALEINKLKTDKTKPKYPVLEQWIR